MLAKKYRLKKDKEFKKVYFKGTIFRNLFLNLKYIANQRGYSRFGISISAKLAKANKRNQLKRKITNFLRENLAKIEPGFDLVLIVKKYHPNWEKPYSEIETIFKKTKLWQK